MNCTDKVSHWFYQCTQAAGFHNDISPANVQNSLRRFSLDRPRWQGRYRPCLVCSATLEEGREKSPLPNVTLFKSLGGNGLLVICAMQNAPNLVAPVTMNRTAWFLSIRPHLRVHQDCWGIFLPAATCCSIWVVYLKTRNLNDVSCFAARRFVVRKSSNRCLRCCVTSCVSLVLEQAQLCHSYPSVLSLISLKTEWTKETGTVCFD